MTRALTRPALLIAGVLGFAPRPCAPLGFAPRRCALGFAPRVCALIGCALLGCAQVLGIPSDPQLAEPPGTPPAEAAAGGSAAPVVPGGTASPGAGDGSNEADGAGQGLPLGAGSPDDRGSTERGPDTGLAGVPGRGSVLIDAGPSELPPELPPVPECEAGLTRQPVDVVFIVDNSGTMGPTTAEVESALPAFAESLDGDGLDYRIILISRHRNDDRAASSEASTSVCIAAPLSGLASCPSPRPALAPRFFQYSIKIDASDSFERVLEASAEPDTYDLTSVGWTEWLRLGAQKVFIEITDADSALSIDAFSSGLAAAAPEHFDSDPSNAGFTFHSITGLVGKSLAPNVYGPNEPIEVLACTGVGSSPDNAGEIYQALSRSTSGLRQSICPAAALGERLQLLADNVYRRSVCVPATGD